MLDQPTSDELLNAVVAFMREKVIPQLPSRDSFEARVAVSALELVRRSIDQGVRGEQEEKNRLAALLGCGGDLISLNRELCARLATGQVTLATAGVREHIWRTTLEKLAVDQPRYSAYLLALDEHSAATDKRSK
jgi:hypothetical protein